MMDILEWVYFSFYKRIKVDLIFNDQIVKSVWAYQAMFPEKDRVPSCEYLQFIISKSRENSFPSDYIEVLQSFNCANEFELDCGFRLSNPSRRRFFENRFKSLYLFHDVLREKLAKMLP